MIQPARETLNNSNPKVALDQSKLSGVPQGVSLRDQWLRARQEFLVKLAEHFRPRSYSELAGLLDNWDFVHFNNVKAGLSSTTSEQLLDLARTIPEELRPRLALLGKYDERGAYLVEAKARGLIASSDQGQLDSLIEASARAIELLQTPAIASLSDRMEIWGRDRIAQPSSPAWMRGRLKVIAEIVAKARIEKRLNFVQGLLSGTGLRLETQLDPAFAAKPGCAVRFRLRYGDLCPEKSLFLLHEGDAPTHAKIWKLNLNVLDALRRAMQEELARGLADPLADFETHRFTMQRLRQQRENQRISTRLIQRQARVSGDSSAGIESKQVQKTVSETVTRGSESSLKSSKQANQLAQAKISGVLEEISLRDEWLRARQEFVFELAEHFRPGSYEELAGLLSNWHFSNFMHVTKGVCSATRVHLLDLARIIPEGLRPRLALLGKYQERGAYLAEAKIRGLIASSAPGQLDSLIEASAKTISLLQPPRIASLSVRMKIWGTERVAKPSSAAWMRGRHDVFAEIATRALFDRRLSSIGGLLKTTRLKLETQLDSACAPNPNCVLEFRSRFTGVCPEKTLFLLHEGDAPIYAKIWKLNPNVIDALHRAMQDELARGLPDPLANFQKDIFTAQELAERRSPRTPSTALAKKQARLSRNSSIDQPSTKPEKKSQESAGKKFKELAGAPIVLSPRRFEQHKGTEKYSLLADGTNPYGVVRFYPETLKKFFADRLGVKTESINEKTSLSELFHLQAEEKDQLDYIDWMDLTLELEGELIICLELGWEKKVVTVLGTYADLENFLVGRIKKRWGCGL